MAENIDKLILQLYEVNGLPKNEIYIALRENLNEKLPRSYIRNVLENKTRYTNPDKTLFSDRVHSMKYELGLSDTFFNQQKEALRKNYVLSGIMKTNQSPKKFKKEVREGIASIILTDES